MARGRGGPRPRWPEAEVARGTMPRALAELAPSAHLEAGLRSLAFVAASYGARPVVVPSASMINDESPRATERGRSFRPSRIGSRLGRVCVCVPV